MDIPLPVLVGLTILLLGALLLAVRTGSLLLAAEQRRLSAVHRLVEARQETAVIRDELVRSLARNAGLKLQVEALEAELTEPAEDDLADSDPDLDLRFPGTQPEADHRGIA